MTWQMHDLNEWRLGRMVRGVVRKPYLAEVYLDEDKNLAWIWMASTPPTEGPDVDDGACLIWRRGACHTFDAAVLEAEAALVAADHGELLSLPSSQEG